MREDHIHVAFHDHGLTGLPYRTLGQVKTKQGCRLVKERGLWTVQVLWNPVAKGSPTETPHLTIRISDRKHHARSKPVSTPVFGDHGEAGEFELLECETSPDESSRETLPFVRCPPNPELFDGRTRHSTTPQICARLARVPPIEKLAREMSSCLSKRLYRRLGFRGGSIVRLHGPFRKGHACPARELLQRVREVKALGVLKPREHITGFAAPETVVPTLVRIHNKRWRLLLMKWTKTLHQTTGTLQNDPCTDDFGEVYA